MNLPFPAVKLRFAEWVYATPESPRIAVVLAETSDGSHAVDADADRDRGISARDLVAGEGDLRILSIAAQHVVEGVLSEYPRRVLFRCPSGTSDLNVAMVTVIEHAVQPDSSANEKGSQHPSNRRQRERTVC